MKPQKAIIYRDTTDDLPENIIVLPVKEEVNKTTLLTALGEACQFPDYYALNWDAAWDCLHDVEIEHLLLDLRNIEKIQQKELKAFNNLIIDAFDAWMQPQLWIVGKKRP